MPEDSINARHAETRRLDAIMFTDIVGFSRQMGADEAHMLRLLELQNQIIQHAVTEHHGHVIKVMGDAFLVDFPSVVLAVQCAQHIQDQFRAHNTDQDSTEQMHVRIGICSGDSVQGNSMSQDFSSLRRHELHKDGRQWWLLEQHVEQALTHLRAANCTKTFRA